MNALNVQILLGDTVSLIHQSEVSLTSKYQHQPLESAMCMCLVMMEILAEFFSVCQLQQALLTLRQQQEVFAEERRLVGEEEREEVREDEKELHRRETQKHQHHRRKERSKESEQTLVY